MLLSLRKVHRHYGTAFAVSCRKTQAQMSNLRALELTATKTATRQATAQGKLVNLALSLALAGVLGMTGLVQVNSQTQPSDRHEDRAPEFRVRTINRTVEAVNYQHRGRSTKLDFAGHRADVVSQRRGRGQEQTRIDCDRG